MSSTTATSELKSWRDLLPQLQSHLSSSKYAKGASLSLKLLTPPSADDDDPIPETLIQTLRKVHARCLLRQGSYKDVLEFCLDKDGLEAEEAYALYRLKMYVPCRELCSKALKNVDGGESTSSRGLRHTYAQCLYRLHETDKAMEIYKHLLSEMDGTEEKEEVLTNLLASCVANATIGMDAGGGNTSVLDENQTAKFLLDGLLHKDPINGNEEEEYNYDLAYNYATFLLTSVSLSSSSLSRSMHLLTQSEQACVSMLKADCANDVEIAEETAPILANRALALLLCGGVENQRKASEIYERLLTLEGSAGGAKIASGNNMAVLNAGRESLFDSWKRLPDLGHEDSEKVGGAAAGAGGQGGQQQQHSHQGGSAASVAGYFTPLQIRSVLFNRALFLLKMNKVVECREALKELRTVITTSGGAGSGKGGGGGRRKKKGKDGAGSGASSKISLSAPPSTSAELKLWMNRICCVESELLKKEGKATEGEEVLVKAAKETAEALTGAIHGRDEFVLEYALSEIALYRHQSTQTETGSGGDGDDTPKSEQQQRTIDLLNSLPETIKSRPATIATLISLHNAAGQTDAASNLLSTMERDDGNIAGRKAVAEYKFSIGLYSDAAELYETLLSEVGEEEYDERMRITAGLVKALSYVDPERATELADTLPQDEEQGEALDGEALEEMEIPRLGKGGGDSGRIRKLIAGEKGKARDDRRKKKNHDAILRHRAKKRDEYLLKLEKDGKYNPDRPTKPDPERWIPKSQRSYGKRGRRGRHKFVGAQGVGTGAGADKDAAKLDVVARKAEVAAGGDGGGGKQRSTAHIDVSAGGGGGRRGGRRR